MPLPRASGLIHDVAAHVLHAASPRPGEQIALRGGPLIEIVKVAVPSAHLVTAVEIYGPGCARCRSCTPMTGATGRGTLDTAACAAASPSSGCVRPPAAGSPDPGRTLQSARYATLRGGPGAGRPVGQR